MRLAARASLMVGDVMLNGLATAAYVGARWGTGPRDGLMSGPLTRAFLPWVAIRDDVGSVPCRRLVRR